MKSHFRCLYKRFRQVFVPSTKPIEEFLETKWPPNQSIEEWFQNLSTLTYQEIEWRAPWMIRSTVLIGCSGHLWVPLTGIWKAISYSSLMVLRQYGYGKVPNDVAELTEKIHDLEMRLRGRDEEVRWQREQHQIQRLEVDLSLGANELQKAREKEQIWRRVSNEKTVKIKVLEEEIFCLTKQLKKKEEKNKEVTKEYTELVDHFIAVEQMAINRQEVFVTMHREGEVFTRQAKDLCEQIEELKKESTPFAIRNEPAMKLLEVAQAHYQKVIKLMRRKKKNDD
ncbi:hypothetical protein GOBAR_DD15218 [Gossypium barbadense]|nr:hypothetical protein GOBAR_DD15218 [Gossypium barbadense]